ncbi:MAG: hypothetical protein AB7S41_00685 [Parvibaculaceae bacterium]
MDPVQFVSWTFWDFSHQVASLSPAAILALLAMSWVGAQLLNTLMDRDSLFHLILSLSALFAGAIVALGLLAHVRIPIANEVVASFMVALFGMGIAALALMASYRRSGV